MYGGEGVSKGVCMFTGHRVIPNSRHNDLCKKLWDVLHALYADGIRTFIAGGALGFDTLAAQAVLELKKTYPDVRLNLCLPCRDQDKLWNAANRERYRNILSLADETYYVSDKYTSTCMHERNRKLVESSSFCIAFLEKDTGGTAYTVNYALSKGLTIIKI